MLFKETLLLVVLSFSMARADMSKEMKQHMIDEHNRVRSLVALGKVQGQPQAADMTLMEWNDDVEATAINSAKRCTGDHDTGEDRKITGYYWVGQNIALTTATGPQRDGVQRWFDEYKDYTYSSQECSAVCGHYTQVVWRKSIYLGCSEITCNGIRYPNLLYCNYAHGGNFNGEKPYQVGEACSKCPNGYSKCVKGLCATPEQCQRNNLNCTDSSSSSGETINLTAYKNSNGILSKAPTTDDSSSGSSNDSGNNGSQETTTTAPSDNGSSGTDPATDCNNDYTSYCSRYAPAYCNHEYVWNRCRKSCRKCEERPCYDACTPMCKQVVSYKLCDHPYYSKKCSKSCGLCDKADDSEANKEAAASKTNCSNDYKDFCDKYTPTYCAYQYFWSRCRKTCKKCDVNVCYDTCTGMCRQVVRYKLCDNPNYKTKCKKSCKKC